MKNREDLGLPEAPEGHFWRVCRLRYAYGWVTHLQLRRKTWYGSKTLAAAEVTDADGLHWPFADAARAVLAASAQERRTKQEVGDYE